MLLIQNGGKQPTVEKYSAGEYAIVYNGQIYNTKELKETLINNGFSFVTRSDTEVLLKAYIHYGKDVVNHLNGIFAFAIWNTKTKELFLARDHLGVKPLFYTMVDGGLIFASELKAIFCPISWFISVDLPTFGRPISAAKPDLNSSCFSMFYLIVFLIIPRIGDAFASAARLSQKPVLSSGFHSPWIIRPKASRSRHIAPSLSRSFPHCRPRRSPAPRRPRAPPAQGPGHLPASPQAAHPAPSEASHKARL